MTARIAFDVAGLPVPQGALVRSPSGGLYNRGAKNLDAWRGAIADEARKVHRDRELLAGALELHVTFRLTRPIGHVGKRGLRGSAPVYPATRPDIDKLARAVLDALTGVVIGDDSQVSDLIVRKRYADPGRQPGASIEIAERLP